ncbi:MAG: transporter ATP-binding protein [Acidobacteriaceae bacterium]|nr:transporter ATP-binding protein [Acidobacteriaceae bacterium]
MTALSPAVEVRELSKRIGKTTLLAPLNLVVSRGSILALVGHNGAGKTTLIKLLLNILLPTTGEATVLGMNSTELRGDAFTRLGYVSENQEMPEWMTVAQMMEHLRPLYPQWEDSGLLEDLQLPPERKIKHLSRGMRMKAALASVLAFGSELLISDEPFSGLDTAVRSEMVQTLLDRTHGREMTVIVSSHDLDEIETFATHVAFLRAGQLLFAEPIETLLTRCREVTVTFAQDIAERARLKLPEGCVATEAQGAMLRFVDLRVNVADHEDAIRKLMPEAVHVQSDGLGLRGIFLALNKGGRR